MCLYIENDAELSVATKDIEVYKVLTREYDPITSQYSNTVFVSPYMYYHYRLDREYTSELSLDYEYYDDDTLSIMFGENSHKLLKNSNVNVDGCVHVNTVELGLHSFSTKEAAIGFISSRMCSNMHAIVRCVIPAGSKYFTGMWVYTDFAHDARHVTVDSYASDTLHVLEVVEYE